MDQHNALLQSWEDKIRDSDGFIRDGIIDKSLWGQVHPKILFILKDGYNPDGTNASWDLRTLVREDPNILSDITFKETACWSYCLQSNLDFPTADDLELRKALRSTAIINIKKNPGN